MNLYTKMIGILLLLNTVAMATPSSQICPEEPLPVAPTGGIDLLTYNIDQGFGGVVNVLESVLFFPIYQGTLPDCRGSFSLPLVLLLLGFGGLFFTIRFGFVNIKLFKHAIQVVQGKFDNPHDKGEISHFKALTSALSATVGLGNIAGVAVALAAGGPGAVFWMWIVAFLGMSMKFASCTLAQLFRQTDSDGHTLGGPMVFLEKGLSQLGMAPLGKVFGYTYAVLIILASFGGGNLFQGNQTFQLIASQAFDQPEQATMQFKLVIGIILAVFVGLVIIGGIKKIGAVTSKLVPAMCIFYSSVCLVIIFSNFSEVPQMFTKIISEAFHGSAMFGGFIGVLIQGMKRAAFSNEAGLGSAAIAHAAAKTDEPIREGAVAMLGPFIDTIVVCTMTALALLITESHLADNVEGVYMTAHAFKTLHPQLPLLLTIAVIIFAYSTMISWSYYGEKAVEYLFGRKAVPGYRIVFSILVALGPILKFENIINFSDMSLFALAFPNIIGMIMLSGRVNDLLKDYLQRLKTGKIQPYN